MIRAIGCESLRPGMVVTDEPGIYIPEENLGVRIEDDVLITETGNKFLSARLPRSPDEIEQIMATQHVEAVQSQATIDRAECGHLYCSSRLTRIFVGVPRVIPFASAWDCCQRPLAGISEIHSIRQGAVGRRAAALNYEHCQSHATSSRHGGAARGRSFSPCSASTTARRATNVGPCRRG